jgi:hypothetical protein
MHTQGKKYSQFAAPGGRWITERRGDGQYVRVFVDGNGNKLTGSAAYKAHRAGGTDKKGAHGKAKNKAKA